MGKRFLRYGIIVAVWLALLSGPVRMLSAREVVDEKGRVVTVPDRPERIVSLAPSLTEILFELGLGDRVAGVTTYSTYPPEAQSKPRVGSYVKINVEKVVSLRPDLAVATADGNDKETVERIAELGVPVYVVDPRSIRDVIRAIIDVGGVTGREEAARDLAGKLDARLQTVIDRARSLDKVRVLMQIGDQPFVTVSRGTIQDELISLAGGINVAGGETMPYPRLSMEEVLLRKPEVIVITSMKREGDFRAETAKWKRWPDIPAVKHSRIYVIDSDLMDRASPRLFDGLEQLFRLLHPQADHGRAGNR